VGQREGLAGKIRLNLVFPGSKAKLAQGQRASQLYASLPSSTVGGRSRDSPMLDKPFCCCCRPIFRAPVSNFESAPAFLNRGLPYFIILT
jgi:hypothetical protein